ncbi:hypothetical protein C8R45DRAFT_1104195 [Mycena sanguinolenta]|nr:hypothetical protein C8R45DRAFT_1104195 [Mycena sanguinolenta]
MPDREIQTRSRTVQSGHPPTPPVPTKPRASGRRKPKPPLEPSNDADVQAPAPKQSKKKKTPAHKNNHDGEVPAPERKRKKKSPNDDGVDVPAPEKNQSKQKPPAQNADVELHPVCPDSPPRPAAATTSAPSSRVASETTLSENQEAPSTAARTAPATDANRPAVVPRSGTDRAAIRQRITELEQQKAKKNDSSTPGVATSSVEAGASRPQPRARYQGAPAHHAFGLDSNTKSLPSGAAPRYAADSRSRTTTESLPSGATPRYAAGSRSRTTTESLPSGAALRYAADFRSRTTTESLPSDAALRYAAETDAETTDAPAASAEPFDDIDKVYYQDDLDETSLSKQVKTEPIMSWDSDWLGRENITNVDSDVDEPLEPQYHHAPVDEGSSRGRRPTRAAAPRRRGTPSRSVDSRGDGSSDPYEDLEDQMDEVDDDEGEGDSSPSKPTRKTTEKRASTKAAQDKVNAKAKGQGKGAAKAKQKGKGKGKGKGKQKEDDQANGEDSSSESEDEEDDGTKPHKRGPIPSNVKDTAVAIQEKYYADIEALAASCGKPAKSLFEMLGSTIKKPRKWTSWNVWQSRNAEMNPYDGSIPLTEYTEQSRAAYEKAMNFDATFTREMSKNSEAVFKRLPYLKEWREKLEKQAVAQLREKGKLRGKIQKEMQPVLHVAEYLLQTYGVWLSGYVVDPNNEASHSFGVGKTYEIYKEQENIEQRVVELGHILGNIELKRRGRVAHALPAAADTDEDERHGRDSHRHLLSAVLSRQLYDRCREVNPKLVPSDPAKFRMPWKAPFCDLAWAAKCRLINFPTALWEARQVIGDQFEIKKVKAKTFKDFMPDFIQANRPQEQDDDDYVDPSQVMVIVPWDAYELQLPLGSQREVPLVVLDDGKTALRSVKHSGAYDKAVEQERKKRAKASKPQPKSKAKSTSAKHQSAQYSDDEAQYDEHQPQYENDDDQQHYDGDQPQYENDDDQQHYDGDQQVYDGDHPQYEDDEQPPYDNAYDWDHTTNEARGHYERDGHPERRRPIPNNERHERSKHHGGYDQGYEHHSRQRATDVRRANHVSPRAGPSNHHEQHYHGRRRSPPPRSPPPSPPPPRARALAPATRPRGATALPPPRTDVRPTHASSSKGVDRNSGAQGRDGQSDSWPPRSAHVPQVQSALPHIDFTARNGEGKRKRQHEPAVDDAGELKRQKMEETVKKKSQPTLLKCRFIVDKNDIGKSKIWYANGLTTASHPTKADRYTYIHDGQKAGAKMPANMTPIIYADGERARYQSEVELQALY